MSSAESEDSDLSSTYSSDGEVQLSITRPGVPAGCKNLDFEDPNLPEVSMPSTESEDSDLSSTYSSDGEVQLSITRPRSTSGQLCLDFVEDNISSTESENSDLSSTYSSEREVQYSIARPRLTAGVKHLEANISSTESENSDLSSTYSSDGEVQYSITIPRATAAVKHLEFEDWERLFVKTAAYKEVRDQLQQHNLVVLTGGLGEGKTTIGQMLCCDYQQQGYNTVFCNGMKDFNMDVLQATKPTLVVIDDMVDDIHKEVIDDIDEIRNEIYTNKFVRVLMIYPNCKRDAFDDICPKMDITQIGRQNWYRTKQEYSQMLQMQTDIPSDTRDYIIANLPSYIGFPKVIKHFSQDRPTTDPVTFFAYPHSHFRKEIERLLGNVDYSAAIIYILISGNKVKDNYRYKYESDYGVREVQSLFPELRTNKLPDMLHTLCANYLCQSGKNISFTDPVIYDACVFVVDNKFPGVLWKSSKVICETGNKKSLPDIPDKTIFISSHNTDMFLTQLVEGTRSGKFRHAFRHPVLSREDNIDRFMTQLGYSFVDVPHLQDTAGSGSFLYWVLQSGNDYLCQKVLQKQELSQVHVSEELACCIRQHDTKSFLYLRQQLLGLQRGDITYTPDYTDADGNSLLMMSVDRNNAKMVNILLKDDAECLVKNKVGNSALHLTSLRGYTDVVMLLLPRMGVWKNLPGQDLRTPVMMAALKGHSQLYEYLADEGKCDLTGVDDNGDTTLHLACQGGSVQIVKHLMSSNLFDINHRGQYGKTPLMIAACSGHRDVFQLLLSQNCHISIEDFSMSETLPYGQVGDCLNMSKFLLARERGQTRFMLTHKKHYISKLKSHLEEKGSSMLLVDVRGLSLLHTAAETGNVELAEFLLLKGKVDINTRDDNGRTPVMLAAAAGHRIMFEFITRNTCDLSLKDTESRGVLHYASQGGNLGIVQDVGYQDVNETDRYNKTPVSYCVERGHKYIFYTLLNTRGDLSVVDTDKNTLLHLASKGGNQAIVEHLLSSGMFDINAVNSDRRTPLLVAAYSGHTDICQHLIVAGADVNTQDYDGNDVLLVAAQTGNLQLAECVLSVKKRVDFVQDKHGKTAAMWAAQRGDADMFALMEDLIPL